MLLLIKKYRILLLIKKHRFANLNRVSRERVPVGQYFSTAVPRNLRVPRVAARSSTETDQNCLARNSQPQFYAVVEI